VTARLVGVALHVRDLAASVAYYSTLLGLERLERPAVEADPEEVWLGAIDGPIVALVARPGPRGDEEPAEWGRLVLAVPDAGAAAALLAGADYWVGEPRLVDHLGDPHTVVRTYDPDGRIIDLIER
jgi:catechol 2,3-dioxygenase-like lactoylglutathione lyase family enzyme